MALRFANKIHCIVNNVVAQGLRIQAQALKATTPPPKTRYPLNQQDANSYIEQLKTRAFVRQAVDANEPDVVRTFNVEVHCRPKPTKDAQQPAISSNIGVVQRYLATKAADPNDKCAPKETKQDKCKKGGQTDKKKCAKMEDDQCPKFKIKDCEKAKNQICNNRKYVFVDCKKTPAPYPAFSEACFEPLPPSTSECKNCPWSAEYNHPTFKPPMNKFAGARPQDKGAKAGKRKYHTGIPRRVTLRFGEPVKSKKDERRQELERQPHPIRPHNVVRKRLAEMYVAQRRVIPPVACKPMPKFPFKPLPEDQATPPVEFRTEQADERAFAKRVEKEESRMDETLERLQNMILAKNRVRVTGPPQCGKQNCDEKKLKRKKCPKKIKPKICPTDLLDNKPYKKFREGKKKRSKKGRKHRKHGKHGKRGKRGHHKHAAGAEGLPAEAEALSDEQMAASKPLTANEQISAMMRSMTARRPSDRPSM